MTFGSFVGNIINIIKSFIGLAAALGLFYFMWGVVKYLLAYDDEKARTDSVKTISYGLIALFVMIAVWGLVQLLSNTIMGTNARPGIPQF
jgi:hypothetical protein